MGKGRAAYEAILNKIADITRDTSKKKLSKAAEKKQIEERKEYLENLREQTKKRNTPGTLAEERSQEKRKALEDLMRDRTQGPIQPVELRAPFSRGQGYKDVGGGDAGRSPKAVDAYFKEFNKKPSLKKGGAVKKMKKGGTVKHNCKRGDGCAKRGKTKGRMI